MPRVFGLILALFVRASAEVDPSWQDTETTTKLWEVIARDNDMDQLRSMLDEDASLATIRPADGRGPLFWAHETSNEAAIELLKMFGAKEEWEDADGKTCTSFEHGKMTKYMEQKRIEEAEIEAEMARQAEEAAASVSFDDEEEDDYADENEDEEDDEDEEWSGSAW